MPVCVFVIKLFGTTKHLAQKDAGKLKFLCATLLL